MGKYDNLQGKRFGRISVISDPIISPKSMRYYVCRCDCGTEKTIRADGLVSGYVVSCGCSRKNKPNMKMRRLNEYRIADNVVYVKLTNSTKELICDIDDWEKLKGHCWLIGSDGYARTNPHLSGDNLVGRKFHINVIGKRDGYLVDHINRNRLDNRKCNLRHVSARGNNWNVGISSNNTSGVTGVYRTQDGKKWRAYIYSKGENHYLGRFDTKEKAVAARKQAETIYHNIETEVAL